MAESETYSWTGRFSDLHPAERASVAQLVADGGAVIGSAAQIHARLGSTYILVLLREQETDRIVGAASLKNPDPAYRAKKFADAGVDLSGFEEAPELGYVVVAEDRRGQSLSSGMIVLVAEGIHQPAFATTDNPVMKKNLSRAGFRQEGREWQGQKGALSLWTISPR